VDRSGAPTRSDRGLITKAQLNGSAVAIAVSRRLRLRGLAGLAGLAGLVRNQGSRARRWSSRPSVTIAGTSAARVWGRSFTEAECAPMRGAQPDAVRTRAGVDGPTPGRFPPTDVNPVFAVCAGDDTDPHGPGTIGAPGATVGGPYRYFYPAFFTALGA